MHPIAYLGKGRSAANALAGRLFDLALVCVVLAQLAVFISLRADHARQVDLTRKAIFAYSGESTESVAYANYLKDRFAIRTADMSLPEGRALLHRNNIGTAQLNVSLLLPDGKGWLKVTDQDAVLEVLSPLEGVPTPYLRGGLAALTIGALWLAGSTWRRRLSYLGALWPVLGLVALGVAAPLCEGCLLDQPKAGPWAVAIGMAAFAAVLAVLSVAAPMPRAFHYASGLLATAGGIGQAWLLLDDPKFCLPCILGAMAWAGVWTISRSAADEDRIRYIVAARAVTMAAAVISAFLSFQQVTTAYSRPSSETKLSFRLAIGKKISDFVDGYRDRASRLLIVTLPSCAACEDARRDLRAAGVAFEEIPHCTLTSSRGCFQGDFKAVSPLFLITDENGRIRHVEAGWAQDTFARQQILNRLKNQLGAKHEH